MIRHTLRAKSLEMSSAAWDELTDFLLDWYNQGTGGNPVSQFISDFGGHPIYDIEDCFRYFQAFNQLSLSDATRYLSLSSEGFGFWYRLYKRYDDRTDKQKAVLELLQSIGKHIK